jgi:hypothetical protein
MFAAPLFFKILYACSTMTSTLADLPTMWETSSLINYSVPNQSAGVLFDYWPIATEKEEIGRSC